MYFFVASRAPPLAADFSMVSVFHSNDTIIYVINFDFFGLNVCNRTKSPCNSQPALELQRYQLLILLPSGATLILKSDFKIKVAPLGTSISHFDMPAPVHFMCNRCVMFAFKLIQLELI